MKIMHESEDFDGMLILGVWMKGKEIPGFDPVRFRTDCDGYVIDYYCYGRKNIYGWEVDFIVSQIQGGTRDLSNLRPVQWENKLRKERLGDTGETLKTGTGALLNNYIGME